MVARMTHNKMTVREWVGMYLATYARNPAVRVCNYGTDSSVSMGENISLNEARHFYRDWIVVDDDISRADCVSLYVKPPEGDAPADADDQKVRPAGDDPVNHPAHYTRGGIECIDAIKASMSPEEFKGFLKGNAIKYLWRYDKKGHQVEDLQKSEWYTERLIREKKGEQDE